MITDPELLGYARQALNMFKTDFELSGKSNFLLASFHQGDKGLHRMRKIEATLTQLLGEDWLNHGGKKEHAFRVIRFATKMIPPDVLIFCTATNMFKPTAKSKAASREMQKKLWERSNESSAERHRMVAEGWMTLMDSFTATAQTPERVCTCVQEIHRGEFIGQPQVMYFGQNEFDGRLKMFAVDEAEEAEMEKVAERFVEHLRKEGRVQ